LEDRLTPASAAALESVTNLYRLTLNRLPDESGLSHFAHRLDAGEPVAVVATGLLGSAEHREKIVTGYYHGILNRAPDSAGLASHVAALGKGISEERLVAGMLASPEKSAGLTDSAFVDLLYRSVLNRTPDQDGQDGHLQSLASGTSRQALALAFLESREASTAVVDSLYHQLLGRTPALAEKLGWISALGRPDFSYADAVARFTSSPEGSARLAIVSPLVEANESNLFFWQQRIGLNSLGGVVTASPSYAYFSDVFNAGSIKQLPANVAVIAEAGNQDRDAIATGGRLFGLTIEFQGGKTASHASWDQIKSVVTSAGDLTQPGAALALAQTIMNTAMNLNDSAAFFTPGEINSDYAKNLVWSQDFEAALNTKDAPSPGQDSPEEIASAITAIVWAGRQILGPDFMIVPVPSSSIQKGPLPDVLGGPWNMADVLTNPSYLGNLKLLTQTEVDALPANVDLLSALHLITANGAPLVNGVLVQQYGAPTPGYPSSDTPGFADPTLPYAVLTSLYGSPQQYGNPPIAPVTPYDGFYFGDIPYQSGFYWAGETLAPTSGFDPTKYLTPTLATTTWNGQTPIPAGT
jgi:hypothetical protein